MISAFSIFLTQPSLENFIVPHIRLVDLFFAFFASFFGTIFIIWLQSINKIQNPNTWLDINWNTNPFLLKQPIQFFNYVGWMMFISYIYPTINTYIKYPEYTLDGVFLLCIGLAVVFGTYISSYLFVKK